MKLNGKRVALLIGPAFDDSETLYPFYRLKEEGAFVEVVSPAEPGSSIAGNAGIALKVDHSVDTARADQYDALVIPGGRSPDRIRANPEVQRFVREFFEGHKPVASVCHGPQVLINAGVVRGVRMTSWASVAQDVRNAGGLYEDSEVVVDKEAGLVSSRSPADMPAWMRAFVEFAS